MDNRGHPQVDSPFNGRFFLPLLFMGLGLGCMIGGLGLAIWGLTGQDSPSDFVVRQTTPPLLVPTTGYIQGQTVAPPPLQATVYIMPMMPVIETPDFSTATVPMPSETALPSITFPTVTPTPENVLSLPERLIIEAIELEAPIEPIGWSIIEINGAVYSQWNVPDRYAVGWHSTSGVPQQGDNLVLNGHHNVYGGVFSRLNEVQIGDVVTVVAHGQAFDYRVVQTMVLPESDQPLAVRTENARWLLPSGDERVTLVTCWPPQGNSHRLVVIARPER